MVKPALTSSRSITGTEFLSVATSHPKQQLSPEIINANHIILLEYALHVLATLNAVLGMINHEICYLWSF